MMKELTVALTWRVQVPATMTIEEIESYFKRHTRSKEGVVIVLMEECDVTYEHNKDDSDDPTSVTYDPRKHMFPRKAKP